MLRDVVVDTNVFRHAANPKDDYWHPSLTFLKVLLDADTLLCVDKGFHLSCGEHKSVVGYEYHEHMRFGSIGLEVLKKLAVQQRIKQVPRRAPQQIARRINQLIRSKKDRVFLGVAYNSCDKTLVSHDFTDFQVRKRPVIKRKIGVLVGTAAECCSAL